MKTKKILIAILVLIAILLIGTIKVQAASADIYSSKETAEVGEEITITAKFTAAAWNVKVSGNGITGASYASQTSDLSEAENVKTFKLDTSKAGTYTISMSGDITDANGDTKEISESCTVVVNEKQVTPDPEPEQTPDPEPETPAVEEKPNFTDANKTMYASKDINLRASWSTSSKATSIGKGTELTVTATSSNRVNGYVWYRVTYNGQTLYVASNLLTDTKPEVKEEQPTEEPAEEHAEELEEPEEPEDETLEQPITPDENEIKEGLKSLEVEGLTLSPEFNSGIYEYRVIVKKDLSELAINAVTITEDATITIAGNENLQEGENLITIVVYNAKKEVEATYQLTVNKSTLDLTNTDKMLQMGNKEAKRNAMIFVVLLAVEIVLLIVIMILKRRNAYYDEDYEEEYLEDEEFTNKEGNVENLEEEAVQEEVRRPRWEKRKGKHF